MTEKDGLRLLLTGGGTGGHLFPAIASAQECISRDPATQVLFVGTRRRVDEKSLAVYGFEGKSIICYGFKGKNPAQLLKALLSLPVGYFQAIAILKEFRPHVVLGVGGYVTGPVVAAARRLGIPVVLHEQNVVPGLANRKLAGMASRVCLSLPESEPYFPAGRTVLTGNPVRKEILALAAQEPVLPSGKPTLLILGGSQGAVGLNSLVCKLAREKDTPLRNCHIIHQTGTVDEERVKACYKELGIEVTSQPFFPEIHKLYSQADCVISRAGATTLAELSVLGKPAILIPFPYAADNHQEKNADHYVAEGAALSFREKEVRPQKFRAAVNMLITDEKKRKKMAVAMRRASFPNASKNIADCCFEAIAGRTG